MACKVQPGRSAKVTFQAQHLEGRLSTPGRLHLQGALSSLQGIPLVHVWYGLVDMWKDAKFDGVGMLGTMYQLTANSGRTGGRTAGRADGRNPAGSNPGQQPLFY